jgi:hypothetical protein
MDLSMFLQVVCAVIVANAACGAFVIGAIAATRLEKRGVHQDDFPLWIYACMIAAPLMTIPGAYILNKSV